MTTKKPKGLLNNEVAGVNQLLPFYYPKAWELYRIGNKNHWIPEEIPMTQDVSQWKDVNAFTDDERLLIKRCLGFMCGTESLVANNLILTFAKFITNGECRQWLGRQNAEELIHNASMVYICETFGFDPIELYEAHENIPSVQAKTDFLQKATTDLTRPEFSTTTIEGVQELVLNAIIQWLITEGIFFYNGFAILQSFGRQNKLKGVGEIIYYTNRDEENHVEFGIFLVENLKKEYPKIWTPEFISTLNDLFMTACELESKFAEECLPNGILGLNINMFRSYTEFLTNKRMQSIGLKPLFPGVVNPFPWLYEITQAKKQINFFEAKVKDYQVGVEDDF